MKVEFFDDPQRQPKSREDVRIKQLGIFVHDGGRRITFGLELTPFLERPSVHVQILNGAGDPAGALTVIESMTSNFSLIIHLRDEQINDPYNLTTTVYYTNPETEKQHVDQQTVTFLALEAGEKRFKFV